MFNSSSASNGPRNPLQLAAHSSQNKKVNSDKKSSKPKFSEEKQDNSQNSTAGSASSRVDNPKLMGLLNSNQIEAHQQLGYHDSPKEKAKAQSNGKETTEAQDHDSEIKIGGVHVSQKAARLSGLFASTIRKEDIFESSSEMADALSITSDEQNLDDISIKQIKDETLRVCKSIEKDIEHIKGVSDHFDKLIEANGKNRDQGAIDFKNHLDDIIEEYGCILSQQKQDISDIDTEEITESLMNLTETLNDKEPLKIFESALEKKWAASLKLISNKVEHTLQSMERIKECDQCRQNIQEPLSLFQKGMAAAEKNNMTLFSGLQELGSAGYEITHPLDAIDALSTYEPKTELMDYFDVFNLSETANILSVYMADKELNLEGDIIISPEESTTLLEKLNDGTCSDHEIKIIISMALQGLENITAQHEGALEPLLPKDEGVLEATPGTLEVAHSASFNYDYGPLRNSREPGELTTLDIGRYSKTPQPTNNSVA